MCVFINFATLVYFNPTLSCGSKPLHVSKGGVWDPWFTPIEATTTFAGWSSWFGLGTSSSNLDEILTPQLRLICRPVRRAGSTLRSPWDCLCTSPSTRSTASRRDGPARVDRWANCLTMAATRSTLPYALSPVYAASIPDGVFDSSR